MNAQQLVDLKLKMSAILDWPWKYKPISELAFLCGVTEQSVILEAIALYYGNTVRFLEEFSIALRGEKHANFEGVPVLKEAYQLDRHFSDPQNYRIQYSPACEARHRQVLTQKDFAGKDLAYKLSNYPQTVAWGFDYSFQTMDRFVEEVLALIRDATVKDLEPIIESRSGVSPYIQASVIFHVIQSKTALGFESEPRFDSIYKKLVDNVRSLPLEYVWKLASNAKGTQGLAILNTSSNGTNLDGVMSSIITAREDESQIARETDWKKLENLLRRFDRPYALNKKVLLRMIELCS